MTVEVHQPKFTNAEIVTKLFKTGNVTPGVGITALCTFDDAPGVYAVFHRERHERELLIFKEERFARGKINFYEKIRFYKTATEFVGRHKLHTFSFQKRSEFIEAAKKGQDQYSQDPRDYNRAYILGELQRLMDI